MCARGCRHRTGGLTWFHNANKDGLIMAKKRVDKTENDTAMKLTLPILTLEYPLIDESEIGGYVRTHIDVALTAAQGNNLRRLSDGLRRRGDVLASGKPVANMQDAVRWLAEKVGEP